MILDQRRIWVADVWYDLCYGFLRSINKTVGVEGAILPRDFLERFIELNSERWYTYPISPCSFFFFLFLFLCFRKT